MTDIDEQASLIHELGQDAYRSTVERVLVRLYGASPGMAKAAAVSVTHSGGDRKTSLAQTLEQLAELKMEGDALVASRV